MNQLHRISGSRNAFDFDAVSAPDADVYILPARADAGANVSCAARDHATEQDGVPHFFWSAKLRPGHGFGQWHAKTIGSPDDLVTFVVHLATRIFFDA